MGKTSRQAQIRLPEAGVQERDAWKKNLSRWGMYASAAGAALSMATDASASIIYSGTLSGNGYKAAFKSTHEGNVATHKTAKFSIGTLGHVSVQLEDYAGTLHQTAALTNRDGFVRVIGNLGMQFYAFSSAAFSSAKNNKIFTSGNPFSKVPVSKRRGLAAFYYAGSAIGTGNSLWKSAVLGEKLLGFTSTGAKTKRVATGFGSWLSASSTVVDGFVGFQGKNGDLGWIDIKVSDRNNDGYPDEAQVIGWAYNNVSGGAIDAGQKVATPEPNSAALGLLGLGAAGLLAWRRRRAEVEASSAAQ